MEAIIFIIVFGLLYYLKNRIDGLENKLKQYEADRVYDIQNAQRAAQQQLNRADNRGPVDNIPAKTVPPRDEAMPDEASDKVSDRASDNDAEQVKKAALADSVQTPKQTDKPQPDKLKQPAHIVARSNPSIKVIDTQGAAVPPDIGSKVAPEFKRDDAGLTAAKEAQPSKILINFEEFFGRQLPIWAGGITLAIAGILIAKYASDNGVLTPLVKIIFGLLFGGGLIAAAEWAYRKEDWVADPRVRQALCGAGIATLYATLYVGHNIYDIFGSFSAFAGMAAVTAGAMALSIRFGAPSAVLGLIGGLATPALINSANPNIPMLTLYLALTIGGLAAVSRMQKWAWLGVGALIGGAGWSVLLIATSALDFATSLSVGALVILLAIGVPFVAFSGSKDSLVRLGSSVVGAGQLAFLVANGSFEPLQWGMFAIILIAGQWLAWRDAKLAIVPTISLGLSLILLIIWPNPNIGIYAAIGVLLAIIHAGPLLYKLWSERGRLQRAAELSLISVGIFFVSLYHNGYEGGVSDYLWTALALIGASISALGIALGWRVSRNGDTAFTLLSSVTAAMIFIAFYCIAPNWSVPIGCAAIGAALLVFAHLAGDIPNKKGDIYLENIAAIFAVLAIALLAVGTNAHVEISRLSGIDIAPILMVSLLRWGGLAAAFIGFSIQSKSKSLRHAMQAMAMLLSYGFAAQFIPAMLLPSVVAIAITALAYVSQQLSPNLAHQSATESAGPELAGPTLPSKFAPKFTPKFAPAIAMGTIVLILWAMEMILNWSVYAAISLIGEPMIVGTAIAKTQDIFARLLVPAILMAAVLALLRGFLPLRIKASAIAIVSVMVFIAIHILYRLAFAQFIGSDFTQYGLTQRLIWGALLIGMGWAIWKRYGGDNLLYITALVCIGTLHAVYYSLILHNPLWANQAVGELPIINLLIPAFGLPVMGIWLLRQMASDLILKYDRLVQIGLMIIVTVFAYSVLRQYFHGSLLSVRGFEPIEDISRSILAIILAIGYLLWGIKSQQRIWRLASLMLMLGAAGKIFFFDAAGLEGLLRIGSFVALGISLIGIGWLYARQLRSAEDSAMAEPLDLKENL